MKNALTILFTLLSVAVIVIGAHLYLEGRYVSKKQFDENRNMVFGDANITIRDDTVQRAETCGIAIAFVDANGLNNVKCTLLGYANNNADNLVHDLSLRACQCMQYRDIQVYMPLSSLCMPVRKNEYWKIRADWGDNKYDPGRITVMWFPFSVNEN